MRLNLPTTSDERHLADGDSVISRTDLRGVITYVNSTFCTISGYDRDELIGQPHNIMRHPDMPAAVFADLWATLRAGKTWQGLIKNRCKDGGYYWVEANANPIHVDGEIVGYMSLRTRPRAQQVERAERAYAALRHVRAPAPWRLQRGRIVRTGWRGWYERLRQPRLRDRIAVIIVVLVLSGLAAAVSALAGMAASNSVLADTQRAHLLPSQQMGTIVRKMMENRILVLDAATRTTPDTLVAYGRRVIANQRDIAALVDAYRRSVDSPEQQQLLERWNAARLRYKASIDAALHALDRGERERAADILANELPQRYEPLVANATALAKQHADAVSQAFRNAQANYTRHRAFALSLLLAAGAMAAWLGIVLFRAVTRPLAEAKRLASAIGSGDLTGSVAHRDDDEIGDMVQSTLNISGNLRGLARDVASAGEATTDAAFLIAENAQAMSLHMVEQRQALSRIGMRSRELRQTMTIQLEHAVVTLGAATGAADQATSGRATLQQVIHSIDDIQQAAHRIGDIVTVMTLIATHTDVLALNAAENQRADERDAAFSLLVDEIRNLARRSHSASGSARQLKNEMVASLERGSLSLAQCRHLLDGIRSESEQVATLMESDIATAQAHAAKVAMIDTDIAQLTCIADDGAELSLQTMERTARLRESATDLLYRMSFFTLPAATAAPAASSTMPSAADTQPHGAPASV